jgi:hypothetical protein
MELVRNYNEIINTLDKIKRINHSVVSNFFPNIERIKLFIDNREFFIKDYGNTTFLFKKHLDFYYLYFISSDASELEKSLKNLVKYTIEDIVIDLVGKDEEIKSILNIFSDVGFEHYQTLIRMTRTKVSDLKNVKLFFHEDISYVSKDEIELVNKFLLQNLDKYCDQIPSVTELNLMIINQTILCYKENGVIGGVFYFERNNLTAHIKSCVVAEKYRDTNAGFKLYNTFYFLCKDCVRFLLWVNVNNDIVIKVSNFDSYKADGLKDNILIRLKGKSDL